MGIPANYVSLELELQRLFFSAKTFETLEEIFDKYSVRYFESIFEKRRPYPFQKVALKFKSPEEYRHYLSSLFLYHPKIVRTTDFRKINIGFIDPSNAINIACSRKYYFHLEQLELGLANDVSTIQNFSNKYGISFEQLQRSSDIFSMIRERRVRMESIALMELINPFLGVVFAKSAAFERKEFEIEYRRVRKLAILLNFSQEIIGRYEKILVDIKNKL